MRVPISWLKSFVDINLPVDMMAEQLNLAGIEVEQIEGVGAFDLKIVAGVVRERSGLAASDYASIMSVDIGERLLQVVSIAPNSRTLPLGTKVAVATAGATLIDRDAQQFRTISVSAGMLYGTRSDGVLCSPSELGTGPDHDILTLGPSARVGSPIIEALTPQPDWEADQVLVLSILANTARVQSILGTAREVSAVTGAILREIVDVVNPAPYADHLLPETAVAPELCRRFSVAEVDRIKVGVSPRWMQRRLALAGIESINNIVDAANYVMVELGQPMHTYDADHLPNTRLGVRLSQEEERLHTIAQPDTEEPMVLPKGILIIVSDDIPVAVAGVIGGSDTAINDNTSRILIESANFDFISVRKSQAALKTYSEASARFSRGVDPGITQLAIRRLVNLLTETIPSLEFKAEADLSRWVAEPHEIDISLKEVNESLGTEFSLPDLVTLLNRDHIEAIANVANGTLRAFIPSSREDLRIPADLLEEFVRLDGYDRLAESMPADPIPMHKRNVDLELRESARDALVRWGLQEVITYTLTNPDVERRLYEGSLSVLAEDPARVHLLNPISSERTVMRRTLLPGLFEVIRNNLRYTDACHIFEIGVVVFPELPSSHPSLPAEPYHVALAMTGPLEPASVHTTQRRFADFYDAADAIQCLLRHMQVDSISLTPSDAPPFQPGACAIVRSGNETLGHVGALHPLVAGAFDLADRRIFCAELDLEQIIRRSSRFFMFQEPPRLPSINLDVSVVVPQHLPAGEVAGVVRAVQSEYLRSVSIFDIYVGPQVPEGHKAIGLRLELNGGLRTLTIEEAHAVRDIAAARLREQFQATIRE